MVQLNLRDKTNCSSLRQLSISSYCCCNSFCSVSSWRSCIVASACNDCCIMELCTAETFRSSQFSPLPLILASVPPLLFPSLTPPSSYPFPSSYLSLAHLTAWPLWLSQTRRREELSSFNKEELLADKNTHKNCKQAKKEAEKQLQKEISGFSTTILKSQELKERLWSTSKQPTLKRLAR